MRSFKSLVSIAGLLVAGAILMAACGSPVQTAVPPTAAATGPAGNGSDAAQQAVDALAATLNVDPLDVAVISVEAVQWPDSCLGVNLRDVMCAMHVVPGYKVVLEVHDQRYTYHTNEDGSSLVAVPYMILTWQEGGQCQTAEVNYDQGISYGPCNGTMQTATFADSTQLLDLAGFSQRFAPFSAETPVGNLTFFGSGSAATTPVEKRMLAEWGRVAVEEASGAQTGTTQGLIIAWHREGGVAGFCDDLSIYVSGKVTASSCKGAQATALGQYFLDPEQLQQLYTWFDTLKPFEMEQTDNATADALTIRLDFYGDGAQEASQADQQAMQSFAETIYVQISQEQGGAGASGALVAAGRGVGHTHE